MRILQLISSVGFFGAESVLVELSVQLAEFGHEVIVVAFDSGRARCTDVLDAARQRGLTAKSFRCRRALDIEAMRGIAGLVSTNGVDVVHSHNYKSNIYAALVGRRTDAALVSTCHNWIDASAKMRLYGQIDRWVLRRFDGVVAVSSTVRARLVRAGFRNEGLYTIENGVDAAMCRNNFGREAIRQELGIEPGTFLVGVVARLSEEKGHVALIDSMQSLRRTHPRCSLVVIGDGPMRAQLEAKVDSLGMVQQVTFLGQRKDVPRLLAALDLFVLPSRVEAQPMSLLEAMAAGLPVVATNVGDIPHMLGHGRFGTLIEPDRPDQLVAALKTHVEQPDAVRRRADSARLEVAERRTSAHMANQYQSVYGRLLGAAAGAVIPA